ncbi:integral membrane protein [Lactiplantibacillus plantarum]|nr:integral membrane protein [Lactiplantibacillus plantarum]MCG0882657.1 integral membrane protein [Lactiplantibacillus plantarum]
MSRYQLKKEAKDLLNGNFVFFLLLFLPVFVIELIAEGANFKSDNVNVQVVDPSVSSIWGSWDTIGLFSSLLAGFLIVGISYVLVDLFRESQTFSDPLKKSFTIVSRGDYFIGSILISLLSFVWIFLWTFLLLVPGIIKSLAYSQAYYIYRDAISKSRALMNGHKWEYFMLQISFIGWGLLIMVTFGIAAIWVQPYYHLTMANYYRHLVATSTEKSRLETAN